MLTFIWKWYADLKTIDHDFNGRKCFQGHRDMEEMVRENDYNEFGQL